MFPETLSIETGQVLGKTKETSFVENFYLAGGTALAVQLGHRKSIDLDFFSRQSFNSVLLKKELSGLGNLAVTSEDNETLNGILDDVKVSFFKYNYDLISPLVNFENIKIAGVKDIAAMKIDTIASRGSKKDFVDFYFLLEKFGINELLGFFNTKFKGIDYNRLHIIKSLTFFDDAEDDPMPIMLKDVSWVRMKFGIVSEVKKII